MKHLVSIETVIGWMNSIRNLTDYERQRALESFWDTQLLSKLWIIEKTKELKIDTSNIYIFGGWTGVLSSLFLSYENINVNRIYSIDIDPWCKSIAESMCGFDNRFISITSDMKIFDYYEKPTLIINTSTEHVDQYTYDIWYSRIPKNSVVLIQGNNFFECEEHIRCSSNLENFKKINKVKNEIYSGELINTQYTRYMTLFSI